MDQNLKTPEKMDRNLRTVTVRITNLAEGGVRTWSDDLAGLSLTCANHEALFAQLTILNILERQGPSDKIVREIHQYIVDEEKFEAHRPQSLRQRRSTGVQAIRGRSARFEALRELTGLAALD